MTQKDLRLQYSGFVIFATKIISVVTGLAFQLMIARAASKTEYDIWFNMNDIATYFTLIAGVLPFWVMRFVAREKKGAIKTGVFSNLIVSVVAAIVFLPLVPLITSALGIAAQYAFIYYFLALQIIEFYSLTVFEACLQARTPKIVGYGLLIQQVGKVGLGFVLIVQFQQPLLGAVVATILSFSVQIAYYLRLLFVEMKQTINWSYTKQWFKGSTINTINVIGNQIASLVFIWLFSFGGEGARGRYGAAAQISNVIAYSSFLSYALYPKLLSERKPEDVTASLKMVLMFALPMAFGAIALSNSFIILLREDYADAGPVLVALSVDALIMVLSGMFSVVLYGLETFDQEAQISLRKLARSRLFLVLFLPYFHAAITIPSTLYALTMLAQNQPLMAALYVSVINMTARFIMFLVLMVMVRRTAKIGIPWSSIQKYIYASLWMALFLFVVPHPTRITLTLGVTAVGGLIYLVALTTVDEETRHLVRAIFAQLKARLKR